MVEIEEYSLPKPIFADATGNTFLIFDYINSAAFTETDVDYVRQCHSERLTEIDSCLVLEKHEESANKLIIKMRVYEPGDGFCGNGSRAVAKYLYDNYTTFSSFAIKSGDYLHELVYDGQDYFVEMGTTLFSDDKKEFVNIRVKDLKYLHNGNLPVQNVALFYAQTSEPHLVTFDDLSLAEIQSIGLYLNENCQEEFPIGINLSRVTVSGNNLVITTFERGINRFTKACGTGSISAIALAKKIGKIGDQPQTMAFVPGGTIVCRKEGNKTFLGGDVYVCYDQ